MKLKYAADLRSSLRWAVGENGVTSIEPTPLGTVLTFGDGRQELLQFDIRGEIIPEEKQGKK